MSSARRPPKRLTLAATASLTGKTEVQVAIERALLRQDIRELVPLFQGYGRLTPEDYEQLSRCFFYGEIRRRGRPKKALALGIIERVGNVQRAADWSEYEFRNWRESELRKKGKRRDRKVAEASRKKQGEIIEANSKLFQVAEWRVAGALRRGRRKPPNRTHAEGEK